MARNKYPEENGQADPGPPRPICLWKKATTRRPCRTSSARPNSQRERSTIIFRPKRRSLKRSFRRIGGAEHRRAGKSAGRPCPEWAGKAAGDLQGGPLQLEPEPDVDRHTLPAGQSPLFGHADRAAVSDRCARVHPADPAGKGSTTAPSRPRTPASWPSPIMVLSKCLAQSSGQHDRRGGDAPPLPNVQRPAAGRRGPPAFGRRNDRRLSWLLPAPSAEPDPLQKTAPTGAVSFRRFTNRRSVYSLDHGGMYAGKHLLGGIFFSS